MLETRPEGNITDTTIFACKFSEAIESAICDAIHAGKYRECRWGSTSFVNDWCSGRKHDPLSDPVKRIRLCIRKSGVEGISRKEIQYITGIPDKDCGDYLRELDKAGLYLNK
jgi:hypothetical protein